MRIQKIDFDQNKRSNQNLYQQAFGLKIDTRRLTELGEYCGVCEKTPKRVLTAVLGCESAIAKIRPANETVNFYRSSHTSGNNHLNVEYGMTHRTVTNDIFDKSEDLEESIMSTVRKLVKLVKEERRVHEKASKNRIFHVPFFVVSKPLRSK